MHKFIKSPFEVNLGMVLASMLTALFFLAAVNTAVAAPALKPVPPRGGESDVQEAISAYLRATTPDPASYEPLYWSGLVLLEENESKAYKWGMRHAYRVGHPQYGILYVDRIFFVAYDGQIETIIEYTNQPCIDCKW